MYDNILNPDYQIGKLFPFMDSYSFLSMKTSLLDAVEDDSQDGKSETPDKKDRSIGKNLAKPRKQ